MRVSLTTPRGALVDTQAEEVSAPGVLGEFGVLPGHISFFSVLRPGVLVCRGKQWQKTYAVGEGILQVARTPEGEDKVLVLVDLAASAEEIDKAAAVKDLAQVDNDLSHWKKEIGGEYQALVTRRDWAQARVDAAGRSTPSAH